MGVLIGLSRVRSRSSCDPIETSGGLALGRSVTDEMQSLRTSAVPPTHCLLSMEYGRLYLSERK